MKDTSHTIVKNITPNYSKTFGSKFVNKPDHMTRVLYQNTGNLGILSDSHNFEVMYGSMYDSEVDSGCLVETNTHWQHKKNFTKDQPSYEKFLAKK